MERWFVFKAYNSQRLYGFGTDDEAERYVDLLNTDRAINHYAAYPYEPTGHEIDDGFNIADELHIRE